MEKFEIYREVVVVQSSVIHAESEEKAIEWAKHMSERYWGNPSPDYETAEYWVGAK